MAGARTPQASTGWGAGRLWQRMWARAPRRLKVTTAGRVLLLLAVVCGLLALNSGNNLLFFVWGMQLGAIVVSGMLSEASLRPLRLQASLPGQARVHEVSFVALRLHNSSRLLPTFALQVLARARVGGQEQWAYAPYELRLEGAHQRSLFAPLRPQKRGRLQLEEVVARTAYPFGLFVKDRRFEPPADIAWVWPARVPTGALAQAVVRAVGETPAGRAGGGEDFFALRAYRPGDPPARVLWRRAAAGRPLMVRELEATHANHVILVLNLQPVAAEDLQALALAERTLAVVGSLAEGLVALGLGVGLWTHGHFVAPGHHSTQGPNANVRLMDALAQLDFSAPLPALPAAPPLQQALQLVGLGAAVGSGHFAALDLAAAPANAEAQPA